jgi:hypothetical protein
MFPNGASVIVIYPIKQPVIIEIWYMCHYGQRFVIRSENAMRQITVSIKNRQTKNRYNFFQLPGEAERYFDNRYKKP